MERKEYGKEDKTSIVMEREGCGMKNQCCDGEKRVWQGRQD